MAAGVPLRRGWGAPSQTRRLHGLLLRSNVVTVVVETRRKEGECETANIARSVTSCGSGAIELSNPPILKDQSLNTGLTSPLGTVSREGKG
jgi:hypothetical protein